MVNTQHQDVDIYEHSLKQRTWNNCPSNAWCLLINEQDTNDS